MSPADWLDGRAIDQHCGPVAALRSHQLQQYLLQIRFHIWTQNVKNIKQ
jgi:hypothetical protein